jgi:hypothetical protein
MHEHAKRFKINLEEDHRLCVFPLYGPLNADAKKGKERRIKAKERFVDRKLRRPWPANLLIGARYCFVNFRVVLWSGPA